MKITAVPTNNLYKQPKTESFKEEKMVLVDVKSLRKGFTITKGAKND